MGTIEQGAWNLVKICMDVRPSERCLIVTDRSSYEIGTKIYEAIEKITKNIVMVVLEDYGKRPFVELPEEIESMIPSMDVTFWLAQSLFGELPMRIRFMDIAPKYARHAHMPDIDRKTMEQGMCADYDDVFKTTVKINEIAKSVTSIKITSTAGTNLTVELDNKMMWRPCHGLYHKKGEWGNEPEGEVFTCPKRVDGILVAEELGDYFGEKYGVLTLPEGISNQPVIFQIENSRVDADKIKSDNKKLLFDVKNYVVTDENSNRVGEFALPTNLELMKLPLTGDFIQNEKSRVHLAFGNPYKEETGADWDSKTHVDCIVKNATVVLQPGNIVLMKDDKYVF